MRRILRLSLVSILLAVGASAQIVPGQYIVELAGQPAVDVSRKTSMQAASPERVAAVRAAQERLSRRLAARGVRVVASVENVANALIVEASETDAAALATDPAVSRVHPVRLYHKLLDRAVLLQKVADAWPLVGGQENAGRGMKIGIIDTGIDSRHPGFQDPDLQVPEGFPKIGSSADLGDTSNKIIVARTYDRRARSARDTEGHGTAVAMVAAGRTATGPRGVITGIAPKAFLGNYKVFGDNEAGASNSSILRALDDALADGMDVVNLSLGSLPAEPPANDVLVRAIERLSAAGVIVVIAAGNDGPDAGTIASPGTAPSALTVGNAATDRGFSSTISTSEGQTYLAMPGSRSEGNPQLSGTVRSVTEWDPSGLACGTLPAGSLQGQIALILRGECFFQNKLQAAERAGAIGAIVYTHAESRAADITMDTGTVTLPAVLISYDDGLALRSRLDSRQTVSATLNFEPVAVPADAGRLGGGSSKGPAYEGAIKPDLLGIGTQVYTANIEQEGRAGFQVVNGTSLAAPMVAGAAALLKAARPGLRTEQYRSLLANSTVPFVVTASGSTAPVQHTGTGLLNVASAVRSTVAATPHALAFGVSAGTFNRRIELTISNLGTVEDTYSLAVESLRGGPLPSLSAASVQIGARSSVFISASLNAGDVLPGEYQGYLVIRSSTSDAQARIPWWYAVPSNTVSFINVAEPPDSADPGSTEEIFVRPSDAAGLAVDVRPAARVLAGRGSVVSIRQALDYPGYWSISVRLGSAEGDNVFEISAGDVSKQVNIVGEN